MTVIYCESELCLHTSWRLCDSCFVRDLQLKKHKRTKEEIKVMISPVLSIVLKLFFA